MGLLVDLDRKKMHHLPLKPKKGHGVGLGTRTVVSR